MPAAIAGIVASAMADSNFSKKEEEICLEENQSTFIVLRTCPWSG
jgi:hypothetical protein